MTTERFFLLEARVENDGSWFGVSGYRQHLLVSGYNRWTNKKVTFFFFVEKSFDWFRNFFPLFKVRLQLP